jgi:hypothetical protein
VILNVLPIKQVWLITYISDIRPTLCVMAVVALEDPDRSSLTLEIVKKLILKVPLSTTRKMELWRRFQHHPVTTDQARGIAPAADFGPGVADNLSLICCHPTDQQMEHECPITEGP